MLKKLSRFLKIYLKYKMNKHVESLPKVDKSITFHYCTVICDVLRHIDVFFEKNNTNCIWFFAFQIILKVGKFATFSERPKAKSVSASGGFAPGHDPLTRDSVPVPHWGICPRPSIIKASHLYLGSPTLYRRHWFLLSNYPPKKCKI